MSKKGLERKLVAVLFVLVLVAFFFAERDSKKIERLYTTAQLLKKSVQRTADVAQDSHRKENPSN